MSLCEWRTIHIFSIMDECHAHQLVGINVKSQSESDDSDIKIADFGFAKKVKKPKSLTTQCGTPGYVAPEILEGKAYDTQADMWSLGVIVYILLGGYPPFIEQNQRELFRKIRKGQYEFHEEYWGQVSDDAKGLIRSLLTVDPDKRYNGDKALKNVWISADASKLESQDLGQNLDKLKQYNAKRKFKAAVNTVVAANKLQSLGFDLKKNLS
jgi:calcium/calmodulin-dependent protein kinase I